MTLFRGDARRGVGLFDVHAAERGVAGVCGAGVAVVAGERRSDAAAPRTRVADRAGCVVAAARSVVAETAGRRTDVVGVAAPGRRVAPVGRAWIMVVAEQGRAALTGAGGAAFDAVAEVAVGAFLVGRAGGTPLRRACEEGERAYDDQPNG